MLNKEFASSSLCSVHALLVHRISNGFATFINMPMSSEQKMCLERVHPVFLLVVFRIFLNICSVGSYYATGELLI